MFRPRRSERGFILVSAIWLLILCGSIAAILMLRSIGMAREVATDGEEVRRDATLKAAAESVFASLLIEGRRSPWGTLPANGVVLMSGTPVSVELTNEAGRVDLNEVDFAKLRLALQGLGVGPAERQGMVAALQARRDAKKPLTSAAELSNLVQGAGLDPCLEDELTIFSGLAEPQPGQMSEPLARALAVPEDEAFKQPAPIGAGSVLRLEARLPQGGAYQLIARITGLQANPVTISSVRRDSACHT